MKILLDECVPRKLKHSFTGHDRHTVPEAGLAGRSNGELLVLAERDGFDVFLTLDQGLEYEQNLRGRKVGVRRGEQRRRKRDRNITGLKGAPGL